MKSLSCINLIMQLEGIGNFKRRYKSIIQRILLLETELIYNLHNDLNNNFNYDFFGIDCKIVGSTNKIYNVKVWKEYDKINCSCTCLDFTMRKNFCKHIYWLGFKKFDIADPVDWSIEKYNNFLNESFINSKIYRKNEKCPICLENIDYQNEMTVNCTNSCLNSVHAECWTRNVTITSKTNCVVCRSEILN